MNPLLEPVLKGALLMDALGILGLGLVGLAAFRLHRRERSWGSRLTGIGAIALLTGRLFVISAPILKEAGVFDGIGPSSTRILAGLTPVLLTLGFAAVVWGVWAHDQWIKETQE